MTKMVWSQGGHIKRRLLYFSIKFHCFPTETNDFIYNESLVIESMFEERLNKKTALFDEMQIRFVRGKVAVDAIFSVQQLMKNVRLPAESFTCLCRDGKTLRPCAKKSNMLGSKKKRRRCGKGGKNKYGNFPWSQSSFEVGVLKFGMV